MLINRSKLFNRLLFLLLIAPFGVGIQLNVGFKTLDMPKIFTFLVLGLMIYSAKTYRIKDVTRLFIVFVFLHFLSAFYSYNVVNNLVLQIGFTILYYSGYFVMDMVIKNEQMLNRVINVFKMAFVVLSTYAVIEFLLGFNPIDVYRSAYHGSETSRFNTELGVLRGFKSSIGNYASSLPFAYLLASLFFLYIVPSYSSRIKNKRYTIFTFLVGIPALFATQSRAMYIFFILVLFMNFFLKRRVSFAKKFGLIVFFPIAIMTVYSSISDNNLGKYIDTYVLNIMETKVGDEGVNGRLENNIIDFNFAMKSPIIGQGSGTLSDSKRSLGEVSLKSEDSSFLLTIFADRGIVSLLLIIGIVAMILHRLYKLGKVNWRLSKHSEAIFYSLLVFSLCLNSSQREESLFIYFAFMGIGVRINEIYRFNEKNGLDNSTHL